MKSIVLYLLLFVVVTAMGCFPKNTAPVPVTPEGNFTGQFTQVHLSKSGKYDTLKANLNISLMRPTSYKVTGDTLKIHAGSYGAYGISGSYYIQFADYTFPTNGWPTKVHLAGVYEYYYDGTTFQLLYKFPTDTLSYQYNFTKVN
jgi:hypothetical protein